MPWPLRIFVGAGLILATFMLALAARSSIWEARQGELVFFGTEEMVETFREECKAKGNQTVITQSARDVFRAICIPKEEGDG